MPDLLCPECGYDVRGAPGAETGEPAAAVCPECGCGFRWRELRHPEPPDTFGAFDRRLVRVGIGANLIAILLIIFGGGQLVACFAYLGVLVCACSLLLSFIDFMLGDLVNADRGRAALAMLLFLSAMILLILSTVTMRGIW